MNPRIRCLDLFGAHFFVTWGWIRPRWGINFSNTTGWGVVLCLGRIDLCACRALPEKGQS